LASLAKQAASAAVAAAAVAESKKAERAPSPSSVRLEIVDEVLPVPENTPSSKNTSPTVKQ
jgi:hypothetical protein